MAGYTLTIRRGETAKPRFQCLGWLSRALRRRLPKVEPSETWPPWSGSRYRSISVLFAGSSRLRSSRWRGFASSPAPCRTAVVPPSGK